MLLPAAWVALEWVRSWLFTGFPFGMLGQSQIASLPVMCQVADIGGEYAVSFWVVAVNVLVFLAIVHRRCLKPLLAPAGVVAAMVLLTLAYGAWRIAQTPAAVSPGPQVMVVQSNFPHERGGRKTVTQDQQLDFHFGRTQEWLSERGEPVDLVVWSETVMPPMNVEVRRGAGAAGFLNDVHARLIDLVRRHDTSLVFGAYAVPTVQAAGAPASEADIRNATYFYTAGVVDDPPRYEKIHLVPYGESVPFKHSIPWLHRLFFKIAAYSVEYVITPGTIERATPYALPSGARFVTPICFEDTDPALMRQLLRPGDDGRKRADFIVNVTNDGWFNATMKHQHLASAAFRSIENRVWTARAANTGISGFIDSTGRWDESMVLPANVEGSLLSGVQIDGRVTLYARVGDVFAMGCLALAIGGILFSLSRYSGRGQGEGSSA